MNTLIARQNETLDALLFRVYGQTAGLVELALQYNPQLANLPYLEIGTLVYMPEVENNHTTIAKTTVQLWD